MAEQTNHDAFEQLLRAEYQRIVAGAADPKPAAEIADAAMRPSGIVARARSSRKGGRLALLGIAAVLATSAAFAGALRLTTRQDESTLPKPTLLAVTPTEAPSPVATPPATAEPVDPYQAVTIRRVESPDAGVGVYVVRADGAERLLRTVPDSLLAPGHSLGTYGSVSESGWLALGDVKNPWPVVVINLADPDYAPWRVDAANVGGIGAKWGPGDLLAAESSMAYQSGSGRGLVIVDPQTRSVRELSLTGGLIGGGPSILWTSDGGILESTDSGDYKVRHIDGSPDTPGYPELFGHNIYFGPGGAQLTLCHVSGNECPVGASPGGVRLTTAEGVSQNVYSPQQGDGRVLSAGFGRDDGTYWLFLDHSGGRQIRVVEMTPDGIRDVSTLDRASNWSNVGISQAAPDGSLLTAFVDMNGSFGFVLIPNGPARPSVHTGNLAGFIATSVLSNVAPGQYVPGAVSPPPTGGETYVLPSVDDLIAAEIKLNPGHAMVDKDWRDPIPGDTARHNYVFSASRTGSFDVNLDCFGPDTVVVVGPNDQTISNPCTHAGGYIDQITVEAGDEIEVSATGETSWRVVLYGTATTGAATPPPVPEPASPDGHNDRPLADVTIPEPVPTP